MPTQGHRRDQGDAGHAGLAQDLACGRVDAGDPVRAARRGVRRAAISSGPTRKMGEAYGTFGIKCSNTVRLPVMGSGSAGDSG